MLLVDADVVADVVALFVTVVLTFIVAAIVAVGLGLWDAMVNIHCLPPAPDQVEGVPI